MPARDAERLRKDAKTIVSLHGTDAVEFWYSVSWPKNMRSGLDIDAALNTDIWMLVDCFGRTQPHFDGDYDTLLCNDKMGFNVEAGRYIPIKHLVAAFQKHLDDAVSERTQ